MKKIVITITLLSLFIGPGAFAADYYLPYCISSDVQWTGMGVSNLSNTDSASLTATVYSQSGQVADTVNRTIAAGGQDVFVVASGTAVEGWIHVASDQPVGGVCFIGKKGSQNYVADIPFEYQTAYRLTVPHLAQDSTWDSVIMVCNPNSSNATLTATIFGKNGSTVASQAYSLKAMGSVDISIASIAGGEVSGSVQLSCTQPITAFVLYQNLKTGNYSYAGINAVNPVSQDSGWVLYDDFSSGSIDPTKSPTNPGFPTTIVG